MRKTAEVFIYKKVRENSNKKRFLTTSEYRSPLPPFSYISFHILVASTLFIIMHYFLIFRVCSRCAIFQQMKLYVLLSSCFSNSFLNAISKSFSKQNVHRSWIKLVMTSFSPRKISTSP